MGKVLRGDITRKNEVDSVCTVNNGDIPREHGDYNSMKKKGESRCSSVENRVGKVLGGDITRNNVVDSVRIVNNGDITI